MIVFTIVWKYYKSIKFILPPASVVTCKMREEEEEKECGYRQPRGNTDCSTEIPGFVQTEFMSAFKSPPFMIARAARLQARLFFPVPVSRPWMMEARLESKLPLRRAFAMESTFWVVFIQVASRLWSGAV